MVLNLVWLGFFLGGFLIALWQLLHGDLEAFSRLLTALFDAAKSGFEIAIGLTGMMALWLGLLRVGEKAGLISKIGDDNVRGNIDDALNRAREILGLPPVEVIAEKESSVE